MMQLFITFFFFLSVAVETSMLGCLKMSFLYLKTIDYLILCSTFLFCLVFIIEEFD